MIASGLICSRQRCMRFARAATSSGPPLATYMCAEDGPRPDPQESSQEVHGCQDGCKRKGACRPAEGGRGGEGGQRAGARIPFDHPFPTDALRQGFRLLASAVPASLRLRPRRPVRRQACTRIDRRSVISPETNKLCSLVHAGLHPTDAEDDAPLRTSPSERLPTE